MYFNGISVSQDYEQSVSWYTKAAEQGNADSQHALGYMHFEGIYFTPDNKIAAYWPNLARNNGSKAAEMLWNDEELWKYIEKH